MLSGYRNRGIPRDPSTFAWRTVLHNTFGGLEYVGAAATFLALNQNKFWSPLAEVMSFAGGIVLFCFAGLTFPHPFRGLVQRIGETVIFGGVVLIVGGCTVGAPNKYLQPTLANPRAAQTWRWAGKNE